jgi:TM2 domain-containing membrane protein YozV
MAKLRRVGNLVAAVCSIVVPGLGQLLQGRTSDALIHFGLAVVLWVFWLGWVVHLYSAVEAAVCKW